MTRLLMGCLKRSRLSMLDDFNSIQERDRRCSLYPVIIAEEECSTFVTQFTIPFCAAL